MKIKSDSRGMTMIELVVAVALLTVVLFSAYFFLDFTLHSMKDTEAQFEAGTDARVAVLKMEKEIRSARDVTIRGAGHTGVEVLDSGMTMNIYTDIDDDDIQEMVQYKLVSNSLKRGDCELGSTPTLHTLVKRVNNDSAKPLFKKDGKQIIIELITVDQNNYLKDHPMTVSTSITMRN